MSAKVTSRSTIYGSEIREDALRVTTIRVPCPGIAHGSEDECLICDAETNGEIEVFMTAHDREALERAAQGLPIDANLALRLSRLHLVELLELTYVPTSQGYAVLGGHGTLVMN